MVNETDIWEYPVQVLVPGTKYSESQVFQYMHICVAHTIRMIYIQFLRLIIHVLHTETYAIVTSKP